MKKYIFCFLLAVAATNSFSQITSSDLSKDENFITYVNSFNSIVDHIATNFDRSMFAAIQTEIDNVKKQNLTKSEELVAVSKILKYFDITQLEISFDKISLSHAALNKRYGTIVNNVFLDSYMTVTINSSSNLPSNFVQDCRRPWRFALCSAAVGVEGALLLATCELASGGIATPLCLAGAATWAANGVAECRERYCAPISAN